MKIRIIFLGLIILSFNSWGQIVKESINSKPIKISWKNNLSGDFSFSNTWDYPLGVKLNEDGRPGCADGGFCPERCYSMLDSNGKVIKDSIEIFYQLLDTTHLYHSIESSAECYEFGGTDYIQVNRISKDSILCQTETNIATHSILQLEIINNICLATIITISIVQLEEEENTNSIYYCKKGELKIDEDLWKEGIMKAQFNFEFENNYDKNYSMFWKGKILTKINNSKS